MPSTGKGASSDERLRISCIDNQRAREACDQPMQAIDFRLEDYGRSVHDPLVRAWWNDVGFVGRCPRCGGWVLFTIRAKKGITVEEAAGYPQLPDDWSTNATLL